MYHVSFPKLGIELTINPIAFSIGDFNIYWYGIIIATGFTIALCYAMINSKRFGIVQDKLIDAIIVGLITGIIGARLYYVVFYPGNTYINNPASIFQIHEGGLAIYGGIIGGLTGGIIVAKIKNINIPSILDIAALGFLIGQCIGRWGNFINQEAFGTETNLPWGMVSENTLLETNNPVHPCFLYESLWCLLGFIFLDIFSRKFKKYNGQIFLLYIVWYGTERFFVEGLRTDSLMLPYVNLRVSQVLAAVSIVISVIILIYFKNKKNHAKKILDRG